MCLAGFLMALATGCSLMGLDLQENQEYVKSKYSDQLNMNVWDFVNSRPDIFSSLLQAVEYLEKDSANGVDTDPNYEDFHKLYIDDIYYEFDEQFNIIEKRGRTYMLLNNNALSNLENNNSYMVVNKVVNPNYVAGDLNNPLMIPGTSWKQYPKAKVAELLRYHVVMGYYDYPHLTSVPVWANTFAQADSAIMMLYLSDTREGYYYVNNFSGSNVRPRTPCLIATNGVVNVMDAYSVMPTMRILNER